MFGAWQAGAWRALAPRFAPELVVGASIGSLNGYAIAGGCTPDELARFWLQPETGRLRYLPKNIRALMSHFSPRVEFAAVLTDLTRMRPEIFRGAQITWKHLAASCALPGVLPQRRIGGRWYSDGGLLNPLPVWAAVELGATRIVALHALPRIPAAWLAHLARGFQRACGHHPPLAAGVELLVIQTEGALGSLADSIRWKRANVERWMEQGFRAAENISLPDCFLHSN